jgi:general secretion pathway protein A
MMPAHLTSMTAPSTLLDFYELREQPFGVTPDPHYLYFSPGHSEALVSLLYGIETGRGFLSLVAKPGMGKTTLLFQLLQRWRGHVHSAFLFQTQCNSRELIRYLLNDLGLKSDGEDIVRMHSELNEFLFRQKLAGKQVVVFIDEAQNLSDSVLETVRLLSDFEATDKKLLQIVLAGQPELANRLSHPGLAQLRQRIAVQARLVALAPSEVVGYINHRLQVAGHPEAGLFTPGALELIAERSRGIPRLINNLCFRALSLGFALQSEQITADAVRRAAEDLSLEPHAATDAVLRQQGAPGATRRGRQLWETFYSWFKGNVVRQRALQASVGALVVGSLAIYLTLHGRSGTAQPTPEVSPIIASAAKARELEPPPAWTVGNKSDAIHGQEITKAGNSQDVLASFTYVIQPNDTLRDLCMSTIGRYDNAVLAQIRKLNPDLRDPNHLLVGQEIRFPLYPLNESKASTPRQQF